MFRELNLERFLAATQGTSRQLLGKLLGKALTPLPPPV
jgi:hypothetical protein